MTRKGPPCPAWSATLPTSIIATLPDDWDHAQNQRARIGLIAPDPTDRGLVGGTWYLDHDRDDLVFGRHDPVRAVGRLLRSGYGVDGTTDILGVVLAGPDADAQTRAIVDAVRSAVPDATFVVTASGRTARSDGSGAAVGRMVDRAIGSPVVAAVVPGGLFLDQAVMAANDITSDDVVRAMDAMTAPDGTPLFADAYPGIRDLVLEVLLMAVDVARPDVSPPRTGRRAERHWPCSADSPLIAVVVRVADPERIAWLQNFLIVFGSLLVEATPFILLGAFVSAAIEVFVPTSTFAHLGRLPRPLQLPAAALAGIAFPVCECGSVPVARRLASKGLAPSAAITFMLAAPILNPVVVASTFVAYRGRDSLWVMVLGRMALGFLVAVAVGWVIGATRKEDMLEGAARRRGRATSRPVRTNRDGRGSPRT